MVAKVNQTPVWCFSLSTSLSALGCILHTKDAGEGMCVFWMLDSDWFLFGNASVVLSSGDYNELRCSVA